MKNSDTGTRDFNKSVVKKLNKKGIFFDGITAMPDSNGSYLNSTTAYRVNDNDTSRILTYEQVIQLSESIKTTREDLYETAEIVWPIGTNGGQKLLELDQSFVGTEDYMGHAYFWNTEYKHELRDASPLLKKKVHDAFIDAGLKLDGHSKKHAQIVKNIIG